MPEKSTVFDALLSRRSIREFTSDPVDITMLHTIVTAGIWAPSGLNNQPWRFVLVQDKALREDLARLTSYSHIIESAPALIAVYLEVEAMYDEVNDVLGLDDRFDLMALLAIGHPQHRNQQSRRKPLSDFILKSF